MALGKAQIREGQVILRGHGIAGPLAEASRPRWAFLDNPAAYR